MQEAIDAVQARLTAIKEENQPSTSHCQQDVKDEPPTPPWKKRLAPVRWPFLVDAATNHTFLVLRHELTALLALRVHVHV